MPYRNETVLQVRKLFDAKYKKEVQEAEDRLEELYKKDPEIKAIDGEVKEKSLDLVKESIRGQERDREKIDEINKSIDSLMKKRAEKVVSLGYPKDYSEIKYECSKCKDTGIVGGNMCECFKKQLNLAGYESSGIGTLIKTQSFETFDKSFYIGEDFDNISAIYDDCVRYADTFSPDESGNLLLMGNTGLGKTHLSTSIAKRVIEKGYDVVYDSAQNIFNAFEAVKFRSASDKDVDIYYDCELLIIDDLGSEMVTSFTVSCLYQIINTRINNHKPMIINTNFTGEELRKNYTDRITSRMFGEFRVFEFTGKDNRMQKLIRNKNTER